jgi:hypothetical protein
MVTKVENNSNEYVMLPMFSPTWMKKTCYQYLIQLKRVRHSTKIQCILKRYALLPKFNTNRLSMPCRQCSVQLKWVCMLPRLSTTRMSIQYYHGSKQVECICHVTNTKVECILCLQGYLHFTWEYHVNKFMYTTHRNSMSPMLRILHMSKPCQQVQYTSYAYVMSTRIPPIQPGLLHTLTYDLHIQIDSERNFTTKEMT